ncbi:MAG TPA: hypothetical protein VN451_06590, partial [Chitinophagaceae bacterium]|nr:hypothetical protein [Chitinophagaceae bacterium]
AITLVISCNNSGEKKENGSDKNMLGQQADSLYKDVLKGHDEGMAGWMHIEKKQKEINRLLDSIAKLPGKAKTDADELKSKLMEAGTALQSAYDEMDKWMSEIKLDSAKDNPEQRIKYFTEEKLKVNRVKDAVNNSLQKADSLLKVKL